jgi:hypothetical protein
MNKVVVALCGAALILGGVGFQNEFMLTTGIVLLAIDYSADRVIAAINKRGGL